MANLVIAKKDMAGRVMIGEGWLLCTHFAVKVGDDPRFQSVETAKAAFKDLAPEPIGEYEAGVVSKLYNAGAKAAVFLRTRVLLEDGQSGDLLRAYRHGDSGEWVLIPERILQVMGKPQFVERPEPFYLVVPGKGLISTNTEALPAWAGDL